MNTGIQDATALAKALSIALKGDEEALDAYAATRRSIALQVVALAGRLSRLANMNKHVRPIRNLVLRTLALNPIFRRFLARRLSGLVYR